jgi:hypothetical protein
MKRIDPDLIKISVDIVRGIYHYENTRRPEQLAELISDEFDCVCLPEDVHDYCYESDLVEEEDAILVYRNIGLI